MNFRGRKKFSIFILNGDTKVCTAVNATLQLCTLP